MVDLQEVTERQEDYVSRVMEAHGFDSLKKTQRLAFEEGILDDGNHLLVAETGNGKTLCAEVITLQEVEDSGNVAYLVPSRQLVRDKKRSINEWVGDDTTVMSGRGKYSDADIAVATFESFYRAILQDNGNARSFDRVILDDFHEIYSSYRGPDIEKAIAATMYEGIDIFAMSATVGNPYELSEWLDARCTISPEGREINIEEIAVDASGTSKKKAVANFVENHQDKGPFLVFNYAKSWASSRASEIADRGVFSDANDDDFVSKMEEKVDGELPSSLKDLAEMMEKGVAYHHSKLPPDVKEWIEELYDQDKIKCICATTTIAYGFDAPVQTVLVADIKRRNEWVGVWEYVQWIGRAARPGYGYDKGYAYTLTNDVDGVEEKYFSSSRSLEPVQTHIDSNPLFRRLLLELIETGWNTPEEIEEYIENTLMWEQLEDEGAWGRGFGDKEDMVREKLRTTASWLEQNEFAVEEHTYQGFTTTTLGEATVDFLFGTFNSYTLTNIKDFYNRIGRENYEPVELLDVVSRVFDESLGERSASDDVTSLLQNNGLPVDEYGITAGIIHWYWCENWPIEYIEEEADVDATYLPSVSRNIGSLLNSTSVFFDANPNTTLPSYFNTYTKRVQKGVRSDEMPFVSGVRGLGRYRVRKIREYLESIEDQQNLPDGSLWDKMTVFYERVDSDDTKFKETIRSNVTGIGDKMSEKLLEVIKSDIDEEFKEKYSVRNEIEKEEKDSEDSTKGTTLDDW